MYVSACISVYSACRARAAALDWCGPEAAPLHEDPDWQGGGEVGGGGQDSR